MGTGYCSTHYDDVADPNGAVRRSEKMLDRQKLIEWLSAQEQESLTQSENLLHTSLYQGKANAFSDVIEQIELGDMQIPEEKVREIAEKCTDLNLYDDDDFTPPDSVPGFEDTDFWDWVQELLRASAKNALGILQDEG